nr:MAG TPA: hypothetical protein [Caudoviricetes sp.]
MSRPRSRKAQSTARQSKKDAPASRKPARASYMLTF